jgi:hypothetical protein
VCDRGRLIARVGAYRASPVKHFWFTRLYSLVLRGDCVTARGTAAATAPGAGRGMFTSPRRDQPTRAYPVGSYAASAYPVALLSRAPSRARSAAPSACGVACKANALRCDHSHLRVACRTTRLALLLHVGAFARVAAASSLHLAQAHEVATWRVPFLVGQRIWWRRDCRWRWRW